MESDADSRLRKAREEAILDHSLSPGGGFFGGLANEHERTVPRLFAVRHDGSAVPTSVAMWRS